MGVAITLNQVPFGVRPICAVELIVILPHVMGRDAIAKQFVGCDRCSPRIFSQGMVSHVL
ncbi:MAG: hypothetical protein AB1589_36810 [Cyanobacteriota bacterium]